MTGKKTPKPSPRPVDSAIPIELDRKRWLVLDFNALAAIEEKTGKSTLDPAFWESFPAGAGDIRLFLWAALRRDDPELTLEGAGKLIHQGNMASINEAFAQIAGEQLTDAGEPPPGKAPAAGGKKKSRRNG